jgi:ketosteroid isomerase-like protein
MSRENGAVVREFNRIFATGNRDEWRDHFYPDVIWDTTASGMPEAGVYRGHQGIERFFRHWLGTWRDYSVDFREHIDAGDSVVVAFRQCGTGRSSGVRSERDFFGVYDLKDSKVIRFCLYESREEALEAARLAE